MIAMSEASIRIGLFIGGLILLCSLEVLFPKRKLAFSRKIRWPANFGIVILYSVLLRIILPISVVAFSGILETKGIGLFNIIDLPLWIETTAAILLLDLCIYGQHIVFHKVPLLWRFHRMHHTDLDFDVTTASRFHPIEIVLSMGIKFAVILIIGANPLAVLLFEIILNLSSMFNHSNIAIPLKLDRWLRKLIITPDMHRIHHSTLIKETNSNYGFFLTWWDFIFKTYTKNPSKPHESMEIGVKEFRDERNLLLLTMLKQPFRD